MKRLLIDTVPSVDDAHAILLALAHPNVQQERFVRLMEYGLQ